MKYVLLCGFLIFSIFGESQITIKGVVKDSQTEEVLIGAYVTSDRSTVTTNVDGEFDIEVNQLPVLISVTYVGYLNREVEVIQEKFQSISLQQENNVLDIMTVTASKYEKRLSESTVSVEVLKPGLIESTNTVDIDAAIEKIPGVQMIDGQANIRGGSGFSYGAGSRVMLLIDDMPALQVDAGFPNWTDIPVENISQVEVLKGAASALYGSSALNGIINIRTGTASSIPETKVSAGYTSYGDLADSTKQWWGDTSRYQYTLTLLHKQKVGKLDIVAGGFYSRLESYNQATFQRRRRVNLKLQYQLSDKLFVRLNSFINKGDNGDFFIWDSDTTGLYRPFGGNPATSDNLRYFVDPSLHYEDSYGNNHKVLTRLHHVGNNNNNNQANVSNTLYGEYQFQKKFEEQRMTTTGGIVYQKSNTDAELFGDTTFSSRNIALYAQLDKQYFEKLNLSGGIRYEHNKQTVPEMFNGLNVPGGEIAEGKMIARLGASYEYAPYSAFRLSWGQGYRFPTITEKFITTSFAGFNIVPNPELQSEQGWTADIGIKQAFKSGGLRGYFDVSLFTSEYENMTEFTADLSNLLSPGFQSRNVGDTRINGVDLGLYSDINIKDVNFSLYGGYTYLNPKYQNFEGDSLIQAGLSTSQNFLKYRSAHNAKMDMEIKWKGFAIGGAVNYSSHIINIDKPLENIEIDLTTGEVLSIDIVGIGRFREANPNGYARVDFRTSYTYKNTKLSFLVNNVANTEYTVRPGIVEAPINYSLRLDHKFEWN